MAAGFDLISSEYGWSDKKIFNLPVARFNQIQAAIRTRRWMQSRQENGRFSWLARSLATYIAAGYMVEGENTAIADAAKLAMDEIEAALLGVEPADNGKKGPKQGSYERLMGFISQKKD